MNPSEIRRQWADRSGAYSPEFYAYRGPDRTSEAVSELLGQHLDTEARILELGCSSGRHLWHLQQEGFKHLNGIEINEEAFAVMERAYPALAETMTFYEDSLEELLPTLGTDRFDAVFSVETLQHVHPDDSWVFAELPRITESLLMTAEHEGGNGATSEPGPEVNYVDGEFPLFYRDWDHIFSRLGCELIETRVHKRDTVRAFRPLK